MGILTPGRRRVSRDEPDALSPVHGCLTNRTGSAVFLCFHSVHPSGPPFLSITPELFERQIAMLARAGFASGTLADLDKLGAGRPPRRLAFITFDDGFADNAEIALPIMLRHGFRPILFILPALIDAGELCWENLGVDRRRYADMLRALTWDQVDEMCAAGAEFGAHSMTHPDLPRLGDAELVHELEASRAAVAAHCGECTSLAYPFGRWDLRVASAAVSAGFRYGFALRSSAARATTPMSIPRLAVDHRDDRARLAVKVFPLSRRLLLSRGYRRLERIRFGHDRSPQAEPAKST
jgi:peptidoglycan/xylan/chitin deacetylase (PgdA/CDA1 family)